MMRMGIGWDSHTLRPTLSSSIIMVGGHPISACFRIEAHSDGDVLLHALADALLGSMALGDIGEWFPETPENAKRKSSAFLPPILRELKRLGCQVLQMDCTLILEEPSLKSHKQSIRENLSKLLGCELACISVKAKRWDGFSMPHKTSVIAAQALVVVGS